MVEKNTNNQNTLPSFDRIAATVGMTAMFAASVLGMAEHIDREGHRLLTVLQPAYATVSQSVHAETGSVEEIRRAGKEEIRHTSASYGAVKRSASVAGTA